MRFKKMYDGENGNAKQIQNNMKRPGTGNILAKVAQNTSDGGNLSQTDRQKTKTLQIELFFIKTPTKTQTNPIFAKFF